MLHGRDELTLEPFLVFDDVGNGASADFRVREIGELRCGVISPNDHLRDLGDIDAGLFRELGARAQLVEHYARATARDVSNMAFYLAFARFKIAVIVQQIYCRYHQGLTKDPRFASMSDVVKILLRASLQSAESRRI